MDIRDMPEYLVNRLMPENLVVTPSGVWPRRTPLFMYINEHREAMRNLHITTIATRNSIHQLDMYSNEGNISARNFFNVPRSIPLRRYWTKYTNSFPKEDAHGTNFPPQIHEAKKDLEESIYDMRLFFVLKIVASFEAFSQCWAVNYLLAKLETNKSWTLNEKKLAIKFSPIHTYKPGWFPMWHDVENEIDGLKSVLLKSPHFFTDQNENPISEPVNGVNLSQALGFWRKFRNAAMHNSVRFTESFVERNQNTFRKIKMGYADELPDLEPDMRLHLTEKVPNMVEVAHLKAAITMNDLLVEVSNGKRGLPKESIRRDGIMSDAYEKPGEMFIPDDHSLSFMVNTNGRERVKLVEGLAREKGIVKKEFIKYKKNQKQKKRHV